MNYWSRRLHFHRALWRAGARSAVARKRVLTETDEDGSRRRIQAHLHRSPSPYQELRFVAHLARPSLHLILQMEPAIEALISLDGAICLSRGMPSLSPGKLPSQQHMFGPVASIPRKSSTAREQVMARSAILRFCAGL